MARWTTGLGTAALLAWLAPPQAIAQEPGGEDSMAAYAAAAAPGAEHGWLATLAGNYEVTMKMWMDPAAEPATSSYRAHSHMALGGRYLMEHYEGTFLGMEFEGMGLTGYDNTLGKFVGMWVDNMGTSILTSVGERDADGRLVMVGDMVDPASEMTIQVKSVTWETENGYVSELYNILPDGTEYRSMELVAKRVEGKTE